MLQSKDIESVILKDNNREPRSGNAKKFEAHIDLVVVTKPDRNARGGMQMPHRIRSRRSTINNVDLRISSELTLLISRNRISRKSILFLISISFIPIGFLGDRMESSRVRNDRNLYAVAGKSRAWSA
jgi:hypothetical protein